MMSECSNALTLYGHIIYFYWSPIWIFPILNTTFLSCCCLYVQSHFATWLHFLLIALIFHKMWNARMNLPRVRHDRGKSCLRVYSLDLDKFVIHLLFWLLIIVTFPMNASSSRIKNQISLWKLRKLSQGFFRHFPTLLRIKPNSNDLHAYTDELTSLAYSLNEIVVKVDLFSPKALMILVLAATTCMNFISCLVRI